MNIIYWGIEVLASFIEIFILYKYYNIFLYKHRNKERQSVYYDMVFAIIGTGIVQLCNNISGFVSFTVLLPVMYVSVSVIFLYKRNYLELFSIASFYILCLEGFDNILSAAIFDFWMEYEVFAGWLTKEKSIHMVIFFFIKVLWILLYILLKKCVYKFAHNKKYVYPLLITSYTGFLGFIYLVNKTLSGFKNTIPSAWLLFLCLFSFSLFSIYFIIMSKEKKTKLYVEQMRNTMLEDNYRAITDIYTNNAKLYHDLNNHLNVLYQMLDSNDVTLAKEYISEIGKPIMILSKTIWTGVDVVDVILNSKIEQMKERQIDIEINVEFPQNTNILPHDICTILANLMDNAIEAVEQLKPPVKIHLTIRRINHFMVIRISNPCIRAENDIYYGTTTKENKELHGWGLRSVLTAVEKYNGTMKYQYRNEEFIVNIMLPFEKEQNKTGAAG